MEGSKGKKVLAALAAVLSYLEAQGQAHHPSPWLTRGRWEQLHRDPRQRRGRGVYERPR